MRTVKELKQIEEQEANDLVFRSLLVWSGAILFIELINEIGIFYVGKSIMRFISAIIIVLTITAFLINQAAKRGKIRYAKYYLLAVVVVQALFTLTTLSVHALLAAVFPIIIASYYNNKRTILLISLLAVIYVPLSVYLSVVLETFPATYLQYILAALSESYVPEEALEAYRSKGAWIKEPSLKIVFFYGLTNAVLTMTFGAMAFNSYRKHNANYKRQIEEIRNIQDNITLSMSEIVESRDSTTGGHIKRTSDVMRIFAGTIQQSDSTHSNEYWQIVIKSAPLHDLGKISIDDAILRKNGKLNEEEYAMIRNHAVKSDELIQKAFSGIDDPQYLQIARNIGRSHHEHWDGSGYPDGLKGTAIPYEARVMTYVDVLDALLSKRSYKEAYSYEKALEIIKEEKGKTFDPNLMDDFIKSYPDIISYYEKAKKES